MEFFSSEAKYDFIGKRTLFGGISIAAVLLALALLGMKGINYGIDFTGGTLVQLRFSAARPIGEVREAVSGLNFGDTVVQNFGSEQEFLIRVERSLGSVEGVGERIAAALSKRFGKGTFEIRRTEMVGPQVGADLRQKAVSSMLFALLGILIYVSIRFQFRQAVAAVIAILHDVVLTLGAFSLSGKEFSLPIVAALLTIVGYSLNDTIVVFDRIRENVRLARRSEFEEIVNNSINQTLSRTILTSGTTLVAVLAFLFLGGAVISDVAFALTVGIIVGTYSSIYVASAILLIWPERGRRRSGKAANPAPTKNRPLSGGPFFKK
ncbi:MAG: protein translocase subunit SecF [bacterium]|nr:protein translocase subunit SecF [bacterium]